MSELNGLRRGSKSDKPGRRYFKANSSAKTFQYNLREEEQIPATSEIEDTAFGYEPGLSNEDLEDIGFSEAKFNEYEDIEGESKTDVRKKLLERQLHKSLGEIPRNLDEIPFTSTRIRPWRLYGVKIHD